MKNDGLKDEHIIVFMYDDIAYNEENPVGLRKDSASGEEKGEGFLDIILLQTSDYFISILKKKHVGSDIHNLRTKTLRQQYKLIKKRTSVDNMYNHGSHIMEYNELDINKKKIFLYIDSNPTNDNSTFIEDNSLLFTPSIVNQHNANLNIDEIIRIKVKKRTSVDNMYNHGSHIMEYNELHINKKKIFLYIDSNPINDNSTFIEDNSLLFTISVMNKHNTELEKIFKNTPRFPSLKIDDLKSKDKTTLSYK
ncbi:hypothetical protein M5K25_022550 [Dendrobium thyrsiflorum]|uniref:Uncharacterized protein n=1 Tax=Dendrobium thyrsiflorum TaxID=117978 RepID=A0ABD0U6D7_DENTH